MTTDGAPSQSPESRRVRRPWVWALFALALVAVGVVLGFRWARAPYDRCSAAILALPLRWIDGEHVVGAFEPDRDGPFAVTVRFPDTASNVGDGGAPPERSDAPRTAPVPPSVRGDLADSVATLAVRHGEEVVAEDRTPRDDSDRTYVGSDIPLIGRFGAAAGGRWTLEVHVEHAAGPVRGQAGRLEVRPDGDDVHDAHIRVWLWRLNVVVIAFVLTLAIASFWVVAGSRARAPRGRAEPSPE